MKEEKICFEEVVEQYKKYIFTICLNILSNPQEAENAMQETFLKIYRFFESFDGTNIKSWIGKIAVNTSIDMKRKALPTSMISIAEFAENDILKDDSPGPEETYIENEMLESIRKICENLPPDYKSAIQKYYYQNKSYAEIAQEEKISVRTVETRLYRAKSIIRERLRQQSEKR